MPMEEKVTMPPSALPLVVKEFVVVPSGPPPFVVQSLEPLTPSIARLLGPRWPAHGFARKVISVGQVDLLTG